MRVDLDKWQHVQTVRTFLIEGLQVDLQRVPVDLDQTQRNHTGCQGRVEILVHDRQHHVLCGGDGSREHRQVGVVADLRLVHDDLQRQLQLAVGQRMHGGGRLPRAQVAVELLQEDLDDEPQLGGGEAARQQQLVGGRVRHARLVVNVERPAPREDGARLAHQPALGARNDQQAQRVHVQR